MKLNKTIMSGASLGAMTAAERAAGRYMRAPDHPDSGGNGGGDGNGDGASGGEGAAGGAPAAAGGGGGDAGAANGGGGGAGAPANEGGDAGGDGKPAGDSNAGDGTILGDAAKGDGGDPDAGGEKGEGEGGSDEGGEGEQAPRLTFGEGEAAAPILGAPEAYDLKPPEGFETFDKAAFDAVEPILRDLNLSNEAAQAVVNAYGEKVLPLLAERAKVEGEALGNTMRREWATQSEQQFDGKEGRPSLQEAKALARQAFLKFGVKADDPFLQLLEDSGLGSHPSMLTFVANVGRGVGETPNLGGSGGGTPERLADRIYGKPIPAG